MEAGGGEGEGNGGGWGGSCSDEGGEEVDKRRGDGTERDGRNIEVGGLGGGGRRSSGMRGRGRNGGGVRE